MEWEKVRKYLKSFAHQVLPVTFCHPEAVKKGSSLFDTI